MLEIQQTIRTDKLRITEKKADNGYEIDSIVILIDQINTFGFAITEKLINVSICNDEYSHFFFLDEYHDEFEIIHDVGKFVIDVYKNSIRIDKIMRGGYEISKRAYYKSTDTDKWIFLHSNSSALSFLFFIFPKHIYSEFITFKQR